MIKERDEWVDYAKAIGILLVVYGHVARGIVNAGIMPNSSTFQLIDSIIYSFHMPLFFFLSGLFLISSFGSGGIKKTFSSKIDSIFYPYVIWSLLQGSVEVLLSKYTNGSVTFNEVFSLFVYPRAQFWFLYALLMIFIVSLISIYFFGLRALLILFILSVASYLFRCDNYSIPAIGFVANNLVFFLMGTIYQQLSLSAFNSKLILFFILFLTIVSQYLFHSAGLTYQDKGVLLLGLSVISLLSVVYVSIWLSGFNINYLSYIGVSSMAIYLMHILAGSGVRVILNKILCVESYVLHLLIGTLLGILLPLLVLRIIKYFNFPYAFSFPISRLWRGD